MTKFALYVPLQAKPGKENEVADFLRSAALLGRVSSHRCFRRVFLAQAKRSLCQRRVRIRRIRHHARRVTPSSNT